METVEIAILWPLSIAAVAWFTWAVTDTSAWESGYSDGEKYMQTQCVKRNAAHWETAADGSTTFTWNEEPTDD